MTREANRGCEEGPGRTVMCQREGRGLAYSGGGACRSLREGSLRSRRAARPGIPASQAAGPLSNAAPVAALARAGRDQR
jgi:hypothetical protein